MSCLKSEFKNNEVVSLKDDTVGHVEAVSTGISTLDKALGVGGLPKGRIVEFFGPESGGKTTLALHCMGACQKQGGIVVFIDAENTLSTEWAETLGVNINQLAISQPDSAEEAYEIINTLLDGEIVPTMIVVDSIVALTPKAETEVKKVEDLQKHIGLQARINSQNLRKIVPKLAKTGTILIIINQVREKFGVTWGYGSNETTAGGRSLRHNCSVRMSVRKSELIKENGQVAGNKVKIKVVKNKVAAPLREAMFSITWVDGVDITSDLFMNAVEVGIIEKKGGWYYFDDKKYHGREGMVEALRQDEELCEALIGELNKVIE